MDVAPRPVAKTLSKLARRKPAPVVVDFKATPLPSAARAGALTSKIKPAPVSRAAPLSVARRPGAKALPKPRAIVLPSRLAAKLAPSLPSKPVRRAVVTPAPAALSSKPSVARSSMPSVAAVAGLKSKPLHESKTKSSNSVDPRKDSLTNCKPRPKSNKPSGAGGGSRAFVPWCG